MDKPEGYSSVRIEEIVKKYSELASEINKTRTTNIENQTLIFVLSESFSNPANIPNVTISQNVIPNIHEVMSMTTSGTMKSVSYGGGTANMEFQSLSGLPFYNFSSSVSLAYIEVIPKLNYFPSISNYFSPEDRIVIHPSGANNYNRYNIYKELGFAKFIAQSGTAYPISNPVIVGSSISDSTTYSNILENISNDSFDLNEFDIIVCHKSVKNNTVILGNLKDYCKKSQKTLVLFSGGISVNYYDNSEFELLEKN